MFKYSSSIFSLKLERGAFTVRITYKVHLNIFLLTNITINYEEVLSY